MNNTLITILGPTAIGKTAKSIALAKAFYSEIISADSRQFYKEMSIGTAVPSAEELAEVPHHFIQNISIDEIYSVGDFERDALQKLDELFKKHRVVFLVGGSGLYLDAVATGLDKFPKTNLGLREELNQQLETEGLEPLQKKLKTLDPLYAEKVDIDNPHRVIRALEISISSGKPFSSFLDQGKAKRNFNMVKIGLDAPRKTIYAHIEKRVDTMMANGLLEEAKTLYPKRGTNALNTVGYKELFRHLDGEWSLDFAISEIKKNTRRFAKRQFTWFRKDREIKWFQHDCLSTEIENFIKEKISS